MKATDMERGDRTALVVDSYYGQVARRYTLPDNASVDIEHLNRNGVWTHTITIEFSGNEVFETEEPTRMGHGVLREDGTIS